MWKIEVGGLYNNKFFGRKIYISPSELGEQRQKFNNTDVYATVMQYEDISKQNDTNLFGPLYLDLDLDFTTDDEYTRLKKDLILIVTYLKLEYGIDKKYMKFYFTGKKGFHILIPCVIFNVSPCKNLNAIYKEIAKDINSNTLESCVDTKIYDCKRLLRLPNSINGKTGRYKVPITYEDIEKFTYEDMLEYANSPKELKKSLIIPTKVDKAIEKFNSFAQSIKDKNTKKVFIPTNIDIDKVTFPECIQSLYCNGAVEGHRNHSTIILSSVLLQKGIDIETVRAMVKKWNDERNVPSLEEDEIDITVNSAFDQVYAGRRYGCSSIKDLGLCNNECKIRSK